MFQDLKAKLLAGQIAFNQALPQALPHLRGKIADEKLLWLASELQGYSNAIEFYQTADHNLPSYRVVPGTLRLMTAEGQLLELRHPYAKRDHIFLSSPIAWIEEIANHNQQEATSLVEVPELTAFMTKNGGGVVCETTQSEVRRIIATFRNQFIDLLDQVEAKSGT